MFSPTRSSAAPAPSSARVYDRWQEWEAETGATILCEAASASVRPPCEPDWEGTERRMDLAFGDDSWDLL